MQEQCAAAAAADGQQPPSTSSRLPGGPGPLARSSCPKNIRLLLLVAIATNAVITTGAVRPATAAHIFQTNLLGEHVKRTSGYRIITRELPLCLAL